MSKTSTSLLETLYGNTAASSPFCRYFTTADWWTRLIFEVADRLASALTEVADERAESRWPRVHALDLEVLENDGRIRSTADHQTEDGRPSIDSAHRLAPVVSPDLRAAMRRRADGGNRATHDEVVILDRVERLDHVRLPHQHQLNRVRNQSRSLARFMPESGKCLVTAVRKALGFCSGHIEVLTLEEPR
jgi:hypothetical protein